MAPRAARSKADIHLARPDSNLVSISTITTPLTTSTRLLRWRPMVAIHGAQTIRPPHCQFICSIIATTYL